MQGARALGVALLIVSAGLGGGAGVASVCAWWKSKDVFDLAEEHAGLGGWIGAVVITPFAILITWLIATRQTRLERNARRSQREQYVDLISTVVDDMEDLLGPFLTVARQGYGQNLNPPSLNEPAMTAGRDLALTSVKDWPSIEMYKHYKKYWYNTTAALDRARNVTPNAISFGKTFAEHLAELSSEVAARDIALAQFKASLPAARMV